MQGKLTKAFKNPLNDIFSFKSFPHSPITGFKDDVTLWFDWDTGPAVIFPLDTPQQMSQKSQY